MTDPATYQVIICSFGSIVEEMENALFRTGFSTVVRESHDGSSAILTADGELLGQMTVLPLHMGAFPACTRAVLDRFPRASMRRGDAFVVNDPYLGGSPHTPDVAVITPVFHGGELVGFCGTIAHKSDLGAINPGGGGSHARDVFQEGLLLPPVRWGPDVEQIVRRNSRTPEVVIGDLRGQVGANQVGVERWESLCDRWGRGTVLAVAEELFERTEARLRLALRGWPDGTYGAEGRLDDDGVGDDPVRLSLAVTKTGDYIRFDFSACDPQTPGPVNIRPPLVRACCYYGLIACIDPSIENNAGLARAVETVFAPHTVLDPDFPAPLNGYVNTLNLATELVLAALSQMCGQRRIACSGSTGGPTLVYQVDGRLAVQNEFMGTGGGARFGRDGVNGIQPHIVNCRCTPIEILESEFPVRIRRFELRTDSGGAGRFRGGLGYDREYEILSDTTVLSLRGNNHRFAPWGIDGGLAGALGTYVVNPGGHGERVLPSRISNVRLQRGDVVLIRKAGGGGCGPAAERDPEAVRADVADGYVSAAAARELYGVPVDDGG